MIKKMGIIILILILICQSAAITTNAEVDSNLDEVSYKQDTKTIKDVSIQWLNDNTTLYLGGDITIQAYVDGVIDNNILWSIRDLDGKSGIVNIEVDGSSARVLATSLGRAEIIAATNDDSYSMRHIVVNVAQYSSDNLSQKVISNNIIPIQSRIINGGIKLLQVEVNRYLSSTSEKVEAIDIYLKKLASQGTLVNEGVNSEHNQYEFYNIRIDGINDVKVELRVDKFDNSYSAIKDALINISKYNVDLGQDYKEESKEKLEEEIQKEEEKQESKEEVKDKEIFEEEKHIVPEAELTQGIENIIISSGYGSESDPFKIEVDKSLSVKDKASIIEMYLKTLIQNKKITIVNMRETSNELIYKLKVSNYEMSRVLRDYNINDFYIEIIINKEDKEEFKPIISMLDKIYKGDNIDDELVQEAKVELNKNEEVLEYNNTDNINKDENIEPKKFENTNKDLEANKMGFATLLISGGVAISGFTVVKKSKFIGNLFKKE